MSSTLPRIRVVAPASIAELLFSSAEVATAIDEWSMFLSPLDALMAALHPSLPPPDRWVGWTAGWVELPGTVLRQLRSAASDDEFVAKFLEWCDGPERSSIDNDDLPLLLGLCLVAAVQSGIARKGIEMRKRSAEMHRHGR